MSFIGSVERLKTAAQDEATGKDIVGEFGTFVPGVPIRGRMVEKTGRLHVKVPKAVGTLAVSVSSQFVVLGRLDIDPIRLTSPDRQPSPDFLLRQQFTWNMEREGGNGTIGDGVVALRSLTTHEAQYGDDEWSYYLRNPSGEQEPPHLRLHLHPDSGLWTPKDLYRPTLAQAAVLAAVGSAEEHLAPFESLADSPLFSPEVVIYSPGSFDSLTDWMLSSDPE